MLVYELIRKKRDGLELTEEEIAYLLENYTRGGLPDYQMSALAMAIFFRGMSERELLAWTKAMIHSGEVLDWSDIDGYKVDKHSTGGVGDKPSLILAPIAAAAGLIVPMISGRGLGHTGGTLDKLESIPGFNTSLDREQFRYVLKTCGMALAGQTEELVPADKKLYALRDVTATVESIPLIASSIMSKKVAEGIQGLVLDVKFGNGAFMREVERARELAQTLVKLGNNGGVNTLALLTTMDQPLGSHVGNSLEVIEACEILKGKIKNDTAELSFRLAAEMLILGGKAPDLDAAFEEVERLVSSGAAFRKFQEVVSAQGGDPKALEDYQRFPQAKGILALTSPENGYIQKIDTFRVGLLAAELGAGRKTIDDNIDHSVGFVFHKKVGDLVAEDEDLVTIYYNDEGTAERVQKELLNCFQFGEAPPEKQPLILEKITG